jgi:dipeptidyl aminopeptidase/acylaminoacyl peptidase
VPQPTLDRMERQQRRTTVRRLTVLARALLLVAGGALICAIAGATTTTADAVAGKLAYGVRGDHGRGWIVAVDVGGATVRRLVPTARHGWSDLEWSPDGNRLAAERIGPGGTRDAIAVAIDGGGARLVTKAARGTGIWDVSWSPDSRTLAFVRGKTSACGGDSLWVVRSDGKDVRRLVRPTAPGVVLSIGEWSPGGKHLLYRTTTYAGADCRAINASGSALLTIAPKGSRPQRVVKTPDTIWDEAWSPDGSRIAYVTCDLEFLLPCQPWLVDITGKERRRISEPVDSIAAVGINWTPDSRELVIPYLCDTTGVCSGAGDCDAKTFSGGLRAIDLQTGQTRSIVSRSGCVGAVVLAISPTAGTIGFVWSLLGGWSTSRPMLVATDGSGLQRLPPPPKVAGGRVDPFPALYLP